MTSSSPELQEMTDTWTSPGALRPHAQAHLLSSTEICKICGERAARHVHYGATTCFSCRAFFRRSLQNKTAAKYICRRKSTCDINVNTRKNCQYCRYMKCLAIGMNPNYVLSEDERKQRFRKKNNLTTEARPESAPINASSPLDIREAEVESVDIAMHSNILVEPEDNQATFPAEFQALSVTGEAPPVSSLPADVTNQSRSSIIIRNTFLDKNSSWSESDKNKTENLMFEKPLTNISRCHEVLFPEDRELFDQGTFYTAFEDIDTSDSGPLEAGLVATAPSIENNSEFGELNGTDRVLTEEDMLEIECIVRDHDAVYFSVNFGEVLIKEMLMCSMFGVQVSSSAALQGYKLQVERITRIANSLNHFTNLVKVDQNALLKENADLIVSLRGAIFFDKKKKGIDQIMSSMGTQDKSMIEKMFKSLMESHEMNHIEYKIFNSIQDPANKMTEDHYTSLQARVADAIGDHVTSVMMTYIILFSSDFVTLENKKVVEKIQFNYLKLLEKHIYCTDPQQTARNRFVNILNAITCVREMADIKKARSITQSAYSSYTQEDSAP